ncbi:MAG: ComF family protein [Treponema sp.]|nr:ComF family protein [Treponema sp.]
MKNLQKLFAHIAGFAHFADFAGLADFVNFAGIINFLFPGNCALCGGSLLDKKEIRYSLCHGCQSSIGINEQRICGLCGKPLSSEIDTCLPCRNRDGEAAFQRLWLLFPYIGKYRKLLTEYKFRKNLYLAVFFAKMIINLIGKEPLLKDAVIVPVPPRPGKIKHTGWDQIEHLVNVMRKNNNKMVICWCLKRKRSKVQKELSRAERLKNLKGRIYLRSAPPKIALVIDDVYTTGSTMEVCSQVLKEGGAEKVYGLCLFYD